MSSSVASPCISICSLDDNNVCIGCFRSAQEIVRWGRLSDDEKRDVLILTEERAIEAGAVIKTSKQGP